MKRTFVLANDMIEAKGYCVEHGLNPRGTDVVLVTLAQPFLRGMAITRTDVVVDILRLHDGMGLHTLKNHDILREEVRRARLRGGSL